MSDDAPGETPEEEVGGDDACWLHLLCEQCGALNRADQAECWRCGTPCKI